MVDFNTAPYFDDFDEAKKFLRVLFRPGYAVQTRELNQAQAILQDQISKHGRHMFKEGSVVIPGRMEALRRRYIKIDGVEKVVIAGGVETGTSTATSAEIDGVIDKTAVGRGVQGDPTGTAGVEALIHAHQSPDPDNNIPEGFIVEYTSSAENTTKGSFDASELCVVTTDVIDDSNYTEYRFRVLPASENPTGIGSVAELQRGVYFIRDQFVVVDSETKIIDAYSTQTPASVGFRVFEDIVTPEEDPTLNDNANGTYNFGAPGAHRYKVDTQLEVKYLEFTTDPDTGETVKTPIRDDNYIEVMQFEGGVEQEHTVVADYSELEKTLARRTFNESGNYSVRPFKVEVKEKRSNNRSVWQQGRFYLQGDIVSDNGNYYVAKTSGTSGPNAPSDVIGTSVENLPDGGLASNVVWSYEPNPQFNGGTTADLDQTEQEALTQEGQLSVLVEPGKGYIKGYEVEKISTTPVDIQKARTSETVRNDSLGGPLGNYVRIQNVNGTPDIQNLVEVELVDSIHNDDSLSEVIGSARIRGFERFGDEYRLYLFNVQINPDSCFSNCVKQIRNSDFYADVVNVTTVDSQGSVSTSGTATVIGSGTRFTQEFEPGNYIEVSGTFHRIASVDSDSQMTLNAAPAVDFDGDAYRLVTTQVNSPQTQLTIYPMFYEAIRTVTGDDGLPEVEYTVVQKFENVTSTNGVLQVSRTSATDAGGSGIGTRFSTSVEPQEIHVTQPNTTSQDNPIIPVDGVSASLGEVTTDVIEINGLPNGAYTILAPVIKEDPQRSGPKSKSLESDRIDIIDAEALQNRRISLSRADVFRIVRISMAASASGDEYDPAGEVDITDWFELDNGQRDTFYDLGAIVRRPEYAAPTGYIRIDFEYFSHGNEGDYFSIDSYPVRESEVPVYETENGVLPLANVLDFRPVIDNSGSTFVGTGGSVSLPPKPGEELTATYQYYKGRFDKIAVDSKGDVLDVKGTPATEPSIPESVSDTMDIVELEVPPYTFSPDDVNINKIDNRRYTMRDIGDLERRIDRLEFYTSLNLLEQQAASLEIPDEEDPRFNRFKNGFVVDNFAGHSTGDTTANDYRAAIDMENQELRPTVYSENVNLIEASSSQSDRLSSGYQITGDMLTLPYENRTFIEQPFATTVENVNPYAVFTFIGSASLNPFSDQWFDTEEVPPIINDVEGNFNAVRDNAASAGILGTVWNGWQTQWTGVRTERRGRRRSTIRTTRERRTGVRTSVRATFSREVVEEDRVISTSAIPFIRSRKVAFLARGLKLGTRIYPYFDGVDVSQYVTPGARLEYGPAVEGQDSEIFDFETNAGASADEIARQIGGDTEEHLNKGDVVYVSKRNGRAFSTPEASPCTAVVLLQEVQPGGVQRSVLVANPRGNFEPGDEITGTISGSKGTVNNWNPSSSGDPLITNFGGDAAGVFEIPNNDQVRFRTGEREFKLLDNSDNDEFNATTRAREPYEAEGTLRRVQDTINSIRNGRIVQTRVDDTRTRSRTTRVTWFDPVAQTFYVEEPTGVFITSIDMFFAAADPEVPITLQVRDVVNGYPGQNVLPFGEVTLTPYQLRDQQREVFGQNYGLSDRTVDLSDNESSEVDVGLAPDRPVRFQFESPIFLQEGFEYCFVLNTDSNNYYMWVSDLGAVDSYSEEGVQTRVFEQPYLGSFFKSQNSSTWTADQNRDIKFRINRASFQNVVSTDSGVSINDESIAPSGTATFHNQRLSKVELSRDPLFTRSGSRYVRILHQNHGFTQEGSTVTLEGFDPGTYGGIDADYLNGAHDIVHVTHDSYVFKVDVAATESTRAGGRGIHATRNVQYDGVQPIVPVQNFPQTRTDFVMKTVSGQTVFGGESPYVKDLTGVEVVENDNNLFNSPRLIASDQNEVVISGAQVKSAELDVDLYTSRENLSPALDTSRLSLTTFHNRVSNPTLFSSTYRPTESEEQQVDGTVFDRVGILYDDTVNIILDGTEIRTTNTSIQSSFRDLQIGQIIEVSNADNNSNDGQYTIVRIAEDGSVVTLDREFSVTENPAGASSGGVAIAYYNNYIAEISPDAGTTAAKYMTQRVDLSEAASNSTALNIRFAAFIPSGAAIDVYYKTKLSADDTTYSNIPWVSAGTVGPNASEGFTDREIRVNGIPTFDIASVKLVMRSDSSSNVPLAKDLVIVANA
jgi:hypothetical protein